MTALAFPNELVADSDTRVVKFSLSPESARDTRISRLIAAGKSLPVKASLQGYYDAMRGLPSGVDQFSTKLAVSYEQGFKRAADTRSRLAGRPWIEAVSERSGSSWVWQIYVEGIPTVGGKAGSENKAYDAVIDARMAIMERHKAAASLAVSAPQVHVCASTDLSIRGEAANSSTMEAEPVLSQPRSAARRRP